jgi:hypothetical protein
MAKSIVSWKYDIFAAVLVFGVLFYIWRELQKEGFVINGDQTVKFMTAEETSAFIMNDPDDYTSRFTQWDLYARKAAIVSDYNRSASRSSLTFTTSQMNRLIAASRMADKFFETHARDCGLDMSKILELPWVFALTKGKAYEDGLPHTRANIIFLSTNVDETPSNLLRVLIHEKVHVYQRLYPEQTMKYLANLGYKRWKYRQGVPRIRSNPDLDPWIYIDPSTESPMMAVYTSDKPKSITDTVIEYGTYEHPYEEMAYLIEKKI